MIPGMKLPLSYDSVGYAVVGNCYVHKSEHSGFPTSWQVLGPGDGHPHDPDNDFGNDHHGSYNTEGDAQGIALRLYRRWLQDQLKELDA